VVKFVRVERRRASSQRARQSGRGEGACGNWGGGACRCRSIRWPLPELARLPFPRWRRRQSSAREQPPAQVPASMLCLARASSRIDALPSVVPAGGTYRRAHGRVMVREVQQGDARRGFPTISIVPIAKLFVEGSSETRPMDLMRPDGNGRRRPSGPSRMN
jgi:hypothetical protein